MVGYYDIRDALEARHALHNSIIHGRRLDIHYSVPKENPSEMDQNQGTLVVFNLDSSITNEELEHLFSDCGSVKEVRDPPNRRDHRFVEFFDSRDAETAMRRLNKMELKVCCLIEHPFGPQHDVYT